MNSNGSTRRDFLRRTGSGAAGVLGASGLAPWARSDAGADVAPRASSVVWEKPRETPVVHACDICVVGGSCTGLFAAVRAARLGADVALSESNGLFGGVATAASVNIWHCRYDTIGEKEIIGGLTIELIDRRVDADRGAFGAIRVMVNCNQLGEAAGTACWLALQNRSGATDIDVKALRRTLAAGGSVVL